MEQKKRVIGKTKYLVTQMNAVAFLEVQTKIIRLLGNGAVALLEEKKPMKEKLAALIPALMDNFDDKVANELVLSLFENGVFIKKAEAVIPVDFENHFIGKITEMWKVVKFILEVNFNLGELFKSSLPITEKESKKKEN